MNKIRIIVHNWKAYWGELKNKRNEEGLTLIELMVVVVILGIIAAIAIPAISSAINSAKQNTTISDLSTIQQALERYYLDNNQYPSNLQSLINSSSGTAYLSVGTAPASGSGTEADAWGYAIGYAPVDSTSSSTDYQGYMLVSGDGTNLFSASSSAPVWSTNASKVIFAAGGTYSGTSIGQTPVLENSNQSIKINNQTINLTSVTSFTDQ